ncbi:Acidic amino acid decarboxylase GADL1 [Amphibalanus amphitrite]|uniref:Acidic amino acid decarboxylase GADL1 n=1 Tax=Amphibalanus amphitrite TaxID=1232801 RepID=A0A6A4VIX7_AMPAM|nr:Acidic amino acid decarboxylase GADL1 [Amphibalanus amphitrite]
MMGKMSGRVAPRVKEAMVRSGTLMVGYQPLPHKQAVNFFRLVFTAVPPLGRAEVDYMLDEIERLGRDL